MLILVNNPELAALLERFEAAGGTLDFLCLQWRDVGSLYASHRAVALAGMAAIRDGWHRKGASLDVEWDQEKLNGGLVNLATFWGTDTPEHQLFGFGMHDMPDGYKSAFFDPPYGLFGRASDREMIDLFNAINRHILGSEPDRAEIFSWSTDWSNYFDAGHEWWGAFYWTIRPSGSDRVFVVAGSTTD